MVNFIIFALENQAEEGVTKKNKDKKSGRKYFIVQLRMLYLYIFY